MWSAGSPVSAIVTAFYFEARSPNPKKRVYLAADQRRGLLLMVKEVARNVAQHAGARNVKLTSAVAYGHLYVTITDDGTGMPLSEGAGPSGRHGLKGLMERAAKLEGIISHEPARQGGTTVRIDLPLAGHHK